jgi:hypothetical protein
MRRGRFLRKALAPQQIGQAIGGNEMVACGQEDFEHLLGAGSAQIVVTQ